MPKSKQKAIHHRPTFRIEKGKAVGVIDDMEVRVMATAEGWAMVRCKGEMPYAAFLKEIEFID